MIWSLACFYRWPPSEIRKLTLSQLAFWFEGAEWWSEERKAAAAKRGRGR